MLISKMTIPLYCELMNSPSVMYSEVFNEYSYNSFNALTGLKDNDDATHSYLDSEGKWN